MKNSKTKSRPMTIAPSSRGSCIDIRANRRLKKTDMQPHPDRQRNKSRSK